MTKVVFIFIVDACTLANVKVQYFGRYCDNKMKMYPYAGLLNSACELLMSCCSSLTWVGQSSPSKCALALPSSHKQYLRLFSLCKGQHLLIMDASCKTYVHPVTYWKLRYSTSMIDIQYNDFEIHSEFLLTSVGILPSFW